MEAAEYSIMKIYASSTDKVGSKLLYEHIVLVARNKSISGVTVYRGIMGYGSSSYQISSSKFWELTEKLPVIIEMIDRSEVLEQFFRYLEPELTGMPKGCLVTLEPVQVKLLKPGKIKA